MTSQNNISNMWDERYSLPGFAFGTFPNKYFKENIDNLNPGKILLAAEGEGRNAVYSALKGWNVYAFDASSEGKKKALKLAEKNKVSIEYQISEMESVTYPFDFFDVIGLIYIHFPAESRQKYYHKLAGYLKPGGLIILECFSKDQLNYHSGGPKDMNMLLSEDDLKDDFSSFNIRFLKKELVFLDEGPFHQGEASVVRMLAEKIL